MRSLVQSDSTVSTLPISDVSIYFKYEFSIKHPVFAISLCRSDISVDKIIVSYISCKKGLSSAISDILIEFQRFFFLIDSLKFANRPDGEVNSYWAIVSSSLPTISADLVYVLIGSS